MAVGRNDSCPCGSGKKYKKCCLEHPRGFLDKVVSSKKNAPHKRSRYLFCLILIVTLGIVAYHNSFDGVFIFDDAVRIIKNKSIHSLSLPWNFLKNTRRPFLYFTLALNYAAGGLRPVGYHLVNLCIHIVSGLLLFFIIYRTTEALSYRRKLKDESLWLAWTVSVIWLVHPLQTQSVTYIIQRAESLMGMFYLLTVYLSMRYMFKPGFLWLIGAAFSCLLGGLTKEVMVTAPIVVLLYDKTFVSNSFKEAFRRHKYLYISLALMWLAIFVLLVVTPSEKDPATTFSKAGVFSLERALTQPKVILHYLRLSVWPRPLVFDYGWLPMKNLIQALPTLSILLGLILCSIWAFIRYPPVGFLALSFFVILLPSSSFVPLHLVFEHRMYLSLAPVLLLIVLAIKKLLALFVIRENTQRRISVILVVAVISLFTFMTIQRNEDYHSELRMWQNTVDTRPDNARAHNNLGEALTRAGDFRQAKEHYLKAIELEPDYVDAYINLGAILAQQGELREAKEYYLRALEIQPRAAVVHNNLGAIYVEEEKYQQAVLCYRRALALGFKEAGVYCNLGIALASQGKFREALVQFQESLHVDPFFSEAQIQIDKIKGILK